MTYPTLWLLGLVHVSASQSSCSLVYLWDGPVPFTDLMSHKYSTRSRTREKPLFKLSVHACYVYVDYARSEYHINSINSGFSV